MTGSAFGFFANVGLFGGPPSPRGPEPTVTLPPGGSATPVTATAPTGTAVYGPATIFESGTLNVSTQGTTGPGGSVTSSASAENVGPGPLTADLLSSSCTGNESGLSGSTTATNASVVLEDPDPDVTGEPGEQVFTVPVNPAPNTEQTGRVNLGGGAFDNFRIVFNEQIATADSITVNAVHLYLLGPIAVGDLIIAQSVCGITATATTTTQPPGVTTTQPPGVTTTQPPGVTTTQPPGVTTTSSTMAPSASTIAPPPSPGRSPLVRTGSTFESLVVFALLTLVLGALVLTGLGGRLVSAGAGSGSGPWGALVRYAVDRRRRRRPWNRRRWS